MFRNHYTTIAAWIIVYISLWLSRDNLVSSKFSKNNCHTGFVSRIIETMIFPFQWYKNRPTYEYVVGLVLLCCISVVAVIKCFSVFSSIEQPMIEAIFEHCNFTFISTVCAVCGYYCLIVDVPHFEKIIYRSAAVIFIGFAIIFSSPTRSLRKPSARSKYSGISDSCAFANSGLVVIKVSTNFTLSLRTRQPAMLMRCRISCP